MVALLLFVVTFLLLMYGGSDRISEWLMPSMPHPLGQTLVLGGLVLVTTLLVPPTRMLAQSLITGFVGILFRVIVSITVAIISAMRTFYSTFAFTSRLQLLAIFASLKSRLTGHAKNQ